MLLRPFGDNTKKFFSPFTFNDLMYLLHKAPKPEQLNYERIFFDLAGGSILSKKNKEGAEYSGNEAQPRLNYARYLAALLVD